VPIRKILNMMPKIKFFCLLIFCLGCEKDYEGTTNWRYRQTEIEIDGVMTDAQIYTVSHKPSKSTEIGMEFFIGNREYKVYYFFFDNLVKINEQIKVPGFDGSQFPKQIDQKKDFYVFASQIFDKEGIAYGGYNLDSIGNTSYIEFEKFGKREVKFTTDLYFHKTYEFDPTLGTPTPGIDKFHLKSVSIIESSRQMVD